MCNPQTNFLTTDNMSEQTAIEKRYTVKPSGAFYVVYDNEKKDSIYIPCPHNVATKKCDRMNLIDQIYWLELQNMNGREDFQEAFKKGIEAAIEHLKDDHITKAKRSTKKNLNRR
jgi:hypothetical protein